MLTAILSAHSIQFQHILNDVGEPSTDLDLFTNTGAEAQSFRTEVNMISTYPIR